MIRCNVISRREVCSTRRMGNDSIMTGTKLYQGVSVGPVARATLPLKPGAELGMARKYLPVREDLHKSLCP